MVIWDDTKLCRPECSQWCLCLPLAKRTPDAIGHVFSYSKIGTKGFVQREAAVFEITPVLPLINGRGTEICAPFYHSPHTKI
ncbi:MAG TPA: hypothetical protein DHW42_09740 [Candidatus Marinimicrobia bacterium]|nr:hypothetical protein [Candidatus Neomarinimicrobiota bacterium]